MLMFERNRGAAKHLLLALLLGFTMAMLAGAAQADEPRQFYFVAKTGPLNSPGIDASAEQVVYLRWDIVEGQLPDDVARIELSRNGQVIMTQAVDALMSASEIQALYQGAAQQQRLLANVSRLQEQALADGVSFNANQFGGYLRQRLSDDKAYAFLASRQDFNIARARYRAAIDRPGSGVFSYELTALGASGERARLGLISLDTSERQSALAPREFVQVYQGQCDAPEFAKDHHSVALGWQTPGVSNATDRFASEVFISGYDLYRANDNLADSITVAPELDIQRLAANATLDGRGNPVIAGLSKVNDLPIMVNAEDAGDPEWLETYDQLQALGIEPGDRRAYYLVARDFAGHYGATQATIVTVPNLIRPATPWDVSLFAQESNNQMQLSFDSVNLDNYLEVFGASRKICNAASAASSGVIEYVGKSQDCNVDTLRRLRLDVAAYRVYRFDNFNSASRFQDSDGDGVSDSAERALNSQCDAAVQPAGAANHWLRGAGLELTEVTLVNSGRKRQRLADNTPGNNKDDVYWYRIASVTADGRSSLLSAPVRALFPNRQLPERPSVFIGRPGRVPCGCELEVVSPTANWSFASAFSADFSLNCGANSFDNVSASDISQGKQGPGECRNPALSKNCAGQSNRSIDYSGPAEGLQLTCTAPIPDDLNLCGQGLTRLKPTYCDGPVAIDDSFLVPAPLDVIVRPNDEDSCVSLYQDINGQATRLASTCGTEDEELSYQLESGFFCAYAVSQDENNNISQTTVLPCILARADNAKSLTTPQPVSFVLKDDTAELAWRLPLEPVAVTLVRLSHTLADGSQQRSVQSFASAGLGAGKVIRKSLDIAALVGDSDRFCVQYRAIGPAATDVKAKQSSWSTPRCSERSAVVQTPPDYLPWPVQLPLAKSPGDLAVRLGTEFIGEPRVGLETYGIFIDLPFIEGWQGLASRCVIEREQDINGALVPKLFLGLQCSDRGRAIVDSAVNALGAMVVYRQARGFTTFAGGQSGSATPATGGTAEGEWVQVSPLIEFAHWDQVDNLSGEAEKLGANFRLADPYLHVYSGNDLGNLRLALWDRYPYTLGESYRYQVVSFDDNMKPIAWNRSAWIEPSLPTATAAAR